MSTTERTRIKARILLIATVLIAFFALGTSQLIAADGQHDQTPADTGNGLSYCDEQYLDLYEQADDLGHPLGRNAVKAGIDDSKRICAQVDKLYNVVTELTVPEPVVETAPATSTSSGGYAIPDYIVQCESGGDYSAQNPSGAYGAYQIMPSTSAAYGCDMSTPAGQDACAAEIYAAEGAAPWSCG